MTAAPAVTIERIRIENWRAIPFLEIECEGASFVAVSGQNGAGKSTVIESVESLFEGGSRPDVIGPAGTSARVSAELSSGVIIERTVTPRGSTVKLRGPEGEEISSPQSHINGWIDKASFRPLDLLDAKPADRVRSILEALPLELPVEEFDAIFETDAKIAAKPRTDDGRHPLAILDDARSRVFDARREENADARSKNAHAEELRQALTGSSESPEDLAERRRALRDELDELRETKSARVLELSEEQQRRSEALSAETSEKIASLRAELAAAQEMLRSELLAAVSEIEGETSERISALSAAIGETAEREKAALKSAATKEALERAVKAARESTEEAARLTRAIERIDRMRTGLLEQSPIPSLSLDGGDVSFAGKPWAKMNTAARASLLLEIAKLRARDVRVLCLDGLEICDAEMREAIRSAAREDGIQIFASTVSDESELRIETA